jgi:hypothetical protein
VIGVESGRQSPAHVPKSAEVPKTIKTGAVG